MFYTNFKNTKYMNFISFLLNTTSLMLAINRLQAVIAFLIITRVSHRKAEATCHSFILSKRS
ncbi:hypothetical protein N499_0460 [Wolbachia pipientis wVitA]|nr:hypothetical protein N499_0460 [Wolbachia pipientis wVitA]